MPKVWAVSACALGEVGVSRDTNDAPKLSALVVTTPRLGVVLAPWVASAPGPCEKGREWPVVHTI